MFTRKNILSGMLVSLISVSGFAETIYVTNTNNSGTGSLRNAITAANANPSFTNILFNIPGTTAERIISVPSVLPAFTAPVEVNTDATQTGTTVLHGPMPVQSFAAFAFNTGSAGSMVESLTFRGFVNALNIRVSSVIVAKNTFENTPGAGTEIIIESAANITIRGNTFTGAANAIAANGINISILDNRFNGERVAIGNSTAVTIASNTFSSISKDALTLDVVDRSTIENNLFLDIAGQGIVVLSGTKNRIVRNTLPTVTGWEIFVNGGHLNNIYDNQIVGYGTFSGVVLQNGLSHTVRKNRIREGSIELTGVSGSPVHGPVRIDSNHIVADPRNNPGHGAITVINGSNAFVESNSLQDNLGNVVYLNNATGITVRLNTMHNNTGSGVYVQGGQSNKISRNIIWQNSNIQQPRPGIVSNNIKAAPVITSVKWNGTNYVISGTGTVANDTIELFQTQYTSIINPLRQDTYAFIKAVKATGSTWSAIVPAGGYFIATVTDQNNNTSTFSATKAVEIVGSTSVARNTPYSYSTGFIPNVNYQWWVNGDATVTSGQGTSDVNITFGSSFSSAFVYVGFTHPVSGWTVYQLNVTYGGSLRKDSSAAHISNTTVYPNPFTSIAKVNLGTDQAKLATVHVYDASGQLVDYTEWLDQDEEVEIGKDLPAGTYLLHVISGEEKQVIRVIKSE